MRKKNYWNQILIGHNKINTKWKVPLVFSPNPLLSLRAHFYTQFLRPNIFFWSNNVNKNWRKNYSRSLYNRNLLLDNTRNRAELLKFMISNVQKYNAYFKNRAKILTKNENRGKPSGINFFLVHFCVKKIVPQLKKILFLFFFQSTKNMFFVDWKCTCLL